MEYVLITGASGFIGSVVAKKILEAKNPKQTLICLFNNHFPKNVPIYHDYSNVIFYRADLTKWQEIKTLFETYDISKIIHLAALASPKSKEIDKFYDINLKSTNYLLDCCQIGVDFIYGSSILVYGNDGCYYENDKCNPKNLYAITKLASEQLMNIYYQQGKIRPRILRFGLTVGQGMTHGRLLEIRKTDKMQLTGRSPGNYNVICHVNDVSNAIIKATNFHKPQLTANICNNDIISLEESLKIVNPNAQLEWIGDNQPECLLGYTDVARYQLNWQPTMTSEQSLKKMVEND